MYKGANFSIRTGDIGSLGDIRDGVGIGLGENGEHVRC